MHRWRFPIEQIAVGPGLVHGVCLCGPDRVHPEHAVALDRRPQLARINRVVAPLTDGAVPLDRLVWAEPYVGGAEGPLDAPT